jgi:hypothetical protein
MNQFLRKLDLDKLDQNSDFLEAYMMKARVKNDREEFFDFVGEICEFVVSKNLTSGQARCILEPIDEEGDMDNIIIMLCRDFVCDRETVRRIVQLFTDLSGVIYMLTLAFYKASENYGVVAENIIYSYDHTLTNTNIENLLENLKDYEDASRDLDKNLPTIKTYLESKRVFDPDEYQKPGWVSLQEGENVSLLTTVPTGNAYDTGEETKFDNLIEDEENFFFEFIKRNKSEDESESFFFSDLPEEVRRSVNEFLKGGVRLESEESKLKIGTPDRVWGPMNRMLDRDCCSGPDSKGPCRMLQCECLEIDEETENEIYLPEDGLSWFKGECDSCRKVIEDMSHSVRFPYRHGGWKGCYCSFECMIKLPPYQIMREENIILNVMKQSIHMHGIMDRSSFC